MKTASRILGTAFFRASYEVQDAPRYGAERRGARFGFGTRVAELLVDGGRVVGVVTGGSGGGRAVGLRADMDALPITEATGLPFASEHSGVMHACGHDGHTTMVLVAATALNALKDQLRGTIADDVHPEDLQTVGIEDLIHLSEVRGDHNPRSHDSLLLGMSGQLL